MHSAALRAIRAAAPDWARRSTCNPHNEGRKAAAELPHSQACPAPTRQVQRGGPAAVAIAANDHDPGAATVGVGSAGRRRRLGGGSLGAHAAGGRALAGSCCMLLLCRHGTGSAQSCG